MKKEEIVIIENHKSKVGLKLVGCIKRDGKSYFSQTDKIYSIYGKSPCLCANGFRGSKTLITENIITGIYQPATPLECERLQTVPDNYTAIVTDPQRYKMLGNGWTVDLVAHIFKGLL